jgi:hypothetical protein
MQHGAGGDSTKDDVGCDEGLAGVEEEDALLGELFESLFEAFVVHGARIS